MRLVNQRPHRIIRMLAPIRVPPSQQAFQIGFAHLQLRRVLLDTEGELRIADDAHQLARQHDELRLRAVQLL